MTTKQDSNYSRQECEALANMVKPQPPAAPPQDSLRNTDHVKNVSSVAGFVPNHEYDKVVQERDQARVELARVTRERDAAIQSGNDIRVERNDLSAQAEATSYVVADLLSGLKLALPYVDGVSDDEVAQADAHTIRGSIGRVEKGRN